MTKAKGYVGTFLKQNGEPRTMRFVRLTDLPAHMQVESTRGPRRLPPGSELVWDVEAKGFRVFNWSTEQGVEEAEFVLA